MKKAVPTPAKPKTFKLATRWAVIINGDLFDMRDTEKDARNLARCLYPDAKIFAAAVRKKEIAVLKVDIRPAKARK